MSRWEGLGGVTSTCISASADRPWIACAEITQQESDCTEQQHQLVYDWHVAPARCPPLVVPSGSELKP